MKGTLGNMLSSMTGGLGDMGNPALRGVIGNALQGRMLRAGANINRAGSMAQGSQGLAVQEAQQRYGSTLADLLSKMGTTGDPERDLALQKSLSDLYKAGLNLGGAPAPVGGGAPAPVGGGGGGGALPNPALFSGAGGGGGALPMGVGPGGGMPPGGGGGGGAERGYYPAVMSPAGGGGGEMPPAGPGRDVNAMANNQALAAGQNAGVGAMLRGTGAGGISGASPAVGQANANDFGSALSTAMERLNQNNLGWGQYQAQQQFGQQQLSANAVQNYLNSVLANVQNQLQATYGINA